jgi:hypothetical protein
MIINTLINILDVERYSDRFNLDLTSSRPSVHSIAMSKSDIQSFFNAAQCACCLLIVAYVLNKFKYRIPSKDSFSC